MRRGRFLQSLERLAIPNITLYWVGIQVLCMFLIWGKPEIASLLELDTARVREGEWWRLVTCLFVPQSLSPLFAVFVYYLFWLMGSALEANWGTARYNFFLLIGALMNIGAAFVPLLAGAQGTGTGLYLSETVFLAFAALYPDFQILLFFIFPVRVKWLALIAWLGLAVQFFMAPDWTDRAMLLASVANFLIFFWRDILLRLKFGQARIRLQAKRAAFNSSISTGDALHRCVICGRTEKSNPELEFRYCPACGNRCFCLEHLHGHVCTLESRL
ncbi:MAG TPA: rhomboid family intramembrane serine protease [Phycisphaerae bacterium]|jgi:hypothetical protein